MRRFVTVCLHRFGGLASHLCNVYAARHDRVWVAPGRLASAPFDAADLAAMRSLSDSRPTTGGYHPTGRWLTVWPRHLDLLYAALGAAPPPPCPRCGGGWTPRRAGGQPDQLLAACAACDGTGRLSRPRLAWRLAGAGSQGVGDNTDFAVTQAVHALPNASLRHPLPPRVAALAATDIDPEVWLDALEESSTEPWVEAAVAYWRAATAAGFWFLSPFTSCPVAHHLPWGRDWHVWQPS